MNRIIDRLSKIKNFINNDHAGKIKISNAANNTGTGETLLV